MPDQRIAIVGTGAIGASVGADLVRAGCEVTFIEQWPEHVEVMRDRGVTVVTPEETMTTQMPVFHLCEVATLRDQFDVVFLGVKAYDTRWACELIKPLVSPSGLVVGLQNCMTIDDVASIVGPERTLGAVIGIASNMFEPGRIQRETPPTGTWFGVGAFDDSTRGREHEVTRLLRHAGAVEEIHDIRAAKWMKLIANCAEVLPSSIVNLPLSEAARIPELREVMEEAGREALRTALALGYELVPIFGKTDDSIDKSDLYAAELLDAVLSDYSRPTTKVATLQDWVKGRRGEVEDMNGVVVREQEKLGGEAPVNARLVEIALRIENGVIQPDPSNLKLLLGLTRQLATPSRGTNSVEPHYH